MYRYMFIYCGTTCPVAGGAVRVGEEVIRLNAPCCVVRVFGIHVCGRCRVKHIHAPIQIDIVDQLVHVFVPVHKARLSCLGEFAEGRDLQAKCVPQQGVGVGEVGSHGEHDIIAAGEAIEALCLLHEMLHAVTHIRLHQAHIVLQQEFLCVRNVLLSMDHNDSCSSPVSWVVSAQDLTCALPGPVRPTGPTHN